MPHPIDGWEGEDCLPIQITAFVFPLKVSTWGFADIKSIRYEESEIEDYPHSPNTVSSHQIALVNYRQLIFIYL